MNDERRYMRPAQFARVFALNVQTVRKMCATGALAAKKIGGNWFIDVEKSMKP